MKMLLVILARVYIDYELPSHGIRIGISLAGNSLGKEIV